MPEKKTPLERRIRPSAPVTIDVDGKEETLLLSFDFLVLARIEERTGLHLVGNILALWGEMSSAKVLGATFWAALLRDQPEYDSEKGYRAAVALLIGNVDSITKALTEAYAVMLTNSQAELFRRVVLNAEELAEDPPKAQTESASSTGSDSGPSPASISDSPRANSAS